MKMKKIQSIIRSNAIAKKWIKSTKTIFFFFRFYLSARDQTVWFVFFFFADFSILNAEHKKPTRERELFACTKKKKKDLPANLRKCNTPQNITEVLRYDIGLIIREFVTCMNNNTLLASAREKFLHIKTIQ